LGGGPARLRGRAPARRSRAARASLARGGGGWTGSVGIDARRW